MESNYTKIFGGNFMLAQRLVGELKVSGIEAIVKDESTSAILGGYAPAVLGDVEVFVNKDEENTALKIVQQVLGNA